MKSADAITSAEVKRCCANLYENDFAKLLLGDSFHPGGLKLTERLGRLLQLDSNTRVLDVASGRGTSAIFLADFFGCEVVGLDYGQANVDRASDAAAEHGLAKLVRFERGDAESLPFRDNSFDAIICECAFCTFPEKPRAAREFARTLKPGGRLGISDLTRAGALPADLDGLLAWIACIADAQPIEKYVEWLRDVGLTSPVTEPHDEVLREMVQQIQAKLLGVEVLTGLKKIDLAGIDLTAAKQMAKAALDAIQQGRLGYVVITAQRP